MHAADQLCDNPVSMNDTPTSCKWDEIDNDVRMTVYSEFVKTGRAPESEELAKAVGASSTDVRNSLQRLGESHVLVLDDKQRIRMAMPFSAVPTGFRVTAATGAWFANCAWDALGIPAMLNTDATIETLCADCDQSITLLVRAGELVQTSGVIHFAVPAAHWWDDIRFT